MAVPSVGWRYTIPWYTIEADTMPHTIKDKQKLINRVRRIRGQLEAIEKALAQDRECSFILQTIAASRGAINGLMAEVMEGHIRLHVASPGRLAGARASRADGTQRMQETEDLIAVIKTYLK
jgi:FrmR/RcnR family transcriptional regulator, repressor of rcnA expression